MFIVLKFSPYDYVKLFEGFYSLFKSFKASVETESEKTIKSLRTDCGGEYCSNTHKNFMVDCDIMKC